MKLRPADLDKLDLSFAPGAEGLRRLAKALRLLADGIWAPPMDFSWDFSVITDERECGTVGCALGLAGGLWPDGRFMCAGILAARLYPRDKRRKCNDFSDLFAPYVHYDRVTPDMVADVIDDYLATGKVRWGALYPEVCR